MDLKANRPVGSLPGAPQANQPVAAGAPHHAWPLFDEAVAHRVVDRLALPDRLALGMTCRAMLAWVDTCPVAGLAVPQAAGAPRSVTVANVRSQAARIAPDLRGMWGDIVGKQVALRAPVRGFDRLEDDLMVVELTTKVFVQGIQAGDQICGLSTWAVVADQASQHGVTPGHWRARAHAWHEVEARRLLGRRDAVAARTHLNAMAVLAEAQGVVPTNLHDQLRKMQQADARLAMNEGTLVAFLERREAEARFAAAIGRAPARSLGDLGSAFAEALAKELVRYRAGAADRWTTQVVES